MEIGDGTSTTDSDGIVTEEIESGTTCFQSNKESNSAVVGAP